MVKQVDYGRYVIKAMETRQRWSARAFRNGVPVGKQQSGETDEAAVLAVKVEIDEEKRRRRNARGADGVPTTEEYLRALTVIDASRLQVTMLTAHYQAPNSTMTATQISAAAGYEGHSVTNLHYGMLGEKIADELEWEVPRHNGVKVSTLALATGVDSDGTAIAESATDLADWRWKMRAQLAAAMEIWLGKRSSEIRG